MANKVHNDKQQSGRFAAADSPHFQQEGIASATPQPMNLTAEPVEFKKEEEDKDKKALQKKSNPGFADDGTPDNPNGADGGGDTGANNGNSGNNGSGGRGNENILVTLQRKYKEEQDEKNIQQKKANAASSFADDGTPVAPPSSNNNNPSSQFKADNTAKRTVTPYQFKGSVHDKPVAKAAPIQRFEFKNSKAYVTPTAQRKVTPYQFYGSVHDKAIQQKTASKSNSGLPGEVQSKMETSMGQDFSNVNIHKDSSQATDAGALAYAQGNDVHFAPGQFQPETQSGQELIGHELAHVKQQREGRVKPTKMLGKGMPVNDDPALEKEADDLGKKAANGEVATENPVQNKVDTPTVQGKFVVQKQDNPQAAAPPQAQGGGQGQAPAPAAPQGPQNAPSPSGGGGGGGGNAPMGNGPAVGAGPQSRGGNKAAKGNAKKAALKGEAGAYLRDAATPAIEKGKENIKTLAKNEKEKEEAQKKREDAEKAAVPPTEEGKSQSNAEQAAKVDDKETPTTDEAAAKANLTTSLNAALPTSVEDVDKFKSNNKTSGIVTAVKAVVNIDVNKVKGTYEEVKTPPAPKQITPAVAMPEIETALETPNMALATDVVKDLKPEHTDFSSYSVDADALVTKEGITDVHLNLVDSGELYEAKLERDGLKADVDSASSDIEKVRTGEIDTLNTDLTKEEEDGRKKMRDDRDKELAAARTDQETAQTDIETKRLEITDHINSIYETAKTTVEGKLSALETTSVTAFDTGQAAAATAFENNVNRRMTAFKNDRYGEGGWDSVGKTISGAANTLTFGLVGSKGGAVAWVEDKILGLDRLPEVKTIFDQERATFVTEIERLITEITASNQLVIDECHQIVADARTEIDGYVESLPEDLRSIGEEVQGEITTKLDELDTQINEKEEELKTQLEEKKELAIEAIDQKIEEMKAAMGGILGKLGALLLNAAIKFFKWALSSVGLDPSQLMGILERGIGTIKAIVKDPMNFLSNLISSVKGGFNQFQANIKGNIMAGLVGWLTGQLSGMSITLPKEWDLKGVLSMGMQVMGMTWGFVRGKLVKHLGPEIVEKAETGFEVVQKVVTEGPMALWEILKEKVGEIKDTIVNGIRDWAVVQIVKNGVIKILSMFNPAGAIVQAIKMIYDVVMFFVENGQRLAQLFSTVTESIASIASGNISGAIGQIASTLKQTVPVMVSFLARLLGLTGVAGAVKKIIQKVTKPIHTAIDKAVRWMVGKIRSWWDKVKKRLGFGKEDGETDDGPDERTKEEKQKDLDAAMLEVKSIDDNPNTTRDDLDVELPKIKNKYKLKRLEAVPVQGKEKEYNIHGEVNPKKVYNLDIDEDLNGKPKGAVDPVKKFMGESHNGNQRLYCTDSNEKRWFWNETRKFWQPLSDQAKLIEAERKANLWLKENNDSFESMVSDDKQLMDSGFDSFGIQEDQDKNDQLVIGDTKGAFGESDQYFAYQGTKSKRENPFSATTDNLAGNLNSQVNELRKEGELDKIRRINSALKNGNVEIVYFLAGNAKISARSLTKVRQVVSKRLIAYLQAAPLKLSAEEAREVVKNVVVKTENI